jgi:hypothetical protein
VEFWQSVVPRLIYASKSIGRQSGELNRAVSSAGKVDAAARAVTKTYGIGGLKTAMEMAGYVGGMSARRCVCRTKLHA